jgi:hypothetical protein
MKSVKRGLIVKKKLVFLHYIKRISQQNYNSSIYDPTFISCYLNHFPTPIFPVKCSYANTDRSSSCRLQACPFKWLSRILKRLRYFQCWRRQAEIQLSVVAKAQLSLTKFNFIFQGNVRWNSVPDSNSELYMYHCQSVKWLTTGWKTRILFPAGAKTFILVTHFQIGFGVRPASYPLGTRRFSRG